MRCATYSAGPKRYGVSFAPSPFWPEHRFRRLGAGLIVAIDEGRGADYVSAVYPAVYGKPLDLSQRTELIEVLDKAGFEGERLLERAKSAPICRQTRAKHQR